MCNNDHYIVVIKSVLNKNFFQLTRHYGLISTTIMNSFVHHNHSLLL